PARPRGSLRVGAGPAVRSPPPPVGAGGGRTRPAATGGAMRLDGKVALITGGASGMGRVASELFASEGAKVVLTDVNDEAGEEAAAAAGHGALYVHADVSKED